MGDRGAEVWVVSTAFPDWAHHLILSVTPVPTISNSSGKSLQHDSANARSDRHVEIDRAHLILFLELLDDLPGWGHASRRIIEASEHVQRGTSDTDDLLLDCRGASHRAH